MSQFTYHAADEECTQRLGAALAESLPNGSVVALLGTLGAGKTRLVQAVAVACGAELGAVVSPTFVLIHEYEARRPIYHFDAYRIKDDDEFFELGAQEYFESDSLSFVEWADRVKGCLPPERLEIAIEVTGPTEREFKVTAHGERYEKVLQSLRTWCRTSDLRKRDFES